MVTMTAPRPSVRVPSAGAFDFETAFADLFARAYRVAFRLLGSRADAEEIAQETLARAYDRWPKLTGGGRGRPDGWVSTVAANLAIDRWRRAGRRLEVHAEVEPSGPSDETTTALRLALHEALARLPRRQREVVVLRFLADLPEAAVAASLGCSVGTVKQHASRGLARLRASLGDVRED
jgi:RNA polymerase sigma-70 factor (sigma-E family)